MVSFPQVLTSVVCPGGWGGVPIEGPHARKAVVKLYVQALEGPSDNPAGGAFSLATVLKLWYACAKGQYYTTSKDGQVQPGDRDDTTETVCGAISEGEGD